jgi:hypothetical protein
VDGHEIAKGPEAWWPLSPGTHYADVTAHFGSKAITRSTFFTVIP